MWFWWVEYNADLPKQRRKSADTASVFYIFRIVVTHVYLTALWMNKQIIALQIR